jgi:hypothetical protein
VFLIQSKGSREFALTSPALKQNALLVCVNGP